MRNKNQSRFNRGLNSCSAKLAIGSAMLAAPLATSHAAIISSNAAITDDSIDNLLVPPVTNTPTAVSFSGIPVFSIQLINTSKGGAPNIEGRWLNFLNGFSFIANTSTSSDPLNLAVGTVIDGTAAYNTSPGTNDFEGVNPLVGFRFNDDGTQVNGWLRIEASATSISITEWAYEDTGAPILAGQLIVPEPNSSLLVVAGGMIGLTLRRRPS